MNFEEALGYLLSLGHETLAIKLGLDNTERLLASLGHPESSYPSIQIAGTNGKGSTASMLEAIFRAAGIKTGLYTSPHLVSITERIRIDGSEISTQEFAQLATLVRDASAELEKTTGALPTFFEQVTAIALLAFRTARVELSILETGLGGRLDATTAVGAAVAAITPIAFDHQEYLGHTLAEIAAEKAAIIRARITRAVVLALPQQPEAEEIILRRCAEAGVVPRLATRDIRVEGVCDTGRLRATFVTPSAVYENVCLALRGRHQLTNAALAVALAETLAERGFTLSHEHIVEGLEGARHAGRLELHTDKTPPILFDGAHNPEGARALRQYLDEFVTSPLTLVFGAMRDKELSAIAETLFPAARLLILTQPDNPRAASPESLLSIVPSTLESCKITLAPSALEALSLARRETPPNGLICVTGSLYLVGEMLKAVTSDE
ncbi:MAG TPA: Mur ligase family protein [Pyrinomonadaceae bacterium]|jgi:dihydrofolate synthase/folylpolyglutamate synthase